MWRSLLEHATFPKALQDELCAAAAQKAHSTQHVQQQHEIDKQADATTQGSSLTATGSRRHGSRAPAHAVGEAAETGGQHARKSRSNGMLHRAVTDEGSGGELEGAVQELKMVILEDFGGHNDGCGASPGLPVPPCAPASHCICHGVGHSPRLQRGSPSKSTCMGNMHAQSSTMWGCM